MERAQAHPPRFLLEVHHAKRRHDVLRPSAGKTQLAARVSAAVAPSIGADIVAALDQQARAVAVEHDVIAADVGAECWRADRAGAAELQAPVIGTDTDQVGVAEAVDLDAADEKDVVAPVLEPVEAMAGV